MIKFIVFFVFLFSINGASESELMSAIVIFRHGDRTPSTTYANDPYQEDAWPVDWGQLTNKGKREHYELGQWFRNRYDGFLSRRYDNNEIYIRSTDVDRTIMSALSDLSGLYMPRGNQIWHPLIRWQPIPVRTIPIADDDLLYQDKYCAKFNTLLEEFSNTTYYQDWLSQVEELYPYLSEHSGENVTSLLWPVTIYDTLFIEERYQYPLPEWTTAVYPQPLKSIVDYAFTISTATQTLARLKSGRLLYEIADRFDTILNGTDTQKFVMYSAHDTTLANILNAIGAYDERPPYAASLLFELRNGTDGPFVNILYKKDNELRYIVLDDCVFNCTLSSFKNSLSPLLISESEWEEECAEA